MRPTLTVSSATALTAANAMDATAVNLHHIDLSSESDDGQQSDSSLSI
jgi:hypothetical protein